MSWKRFAVLVTVAVVAVVATACGPSPTGTPIVSLSSPYHGVDWGSAAPPGPAPGNTVTFNSCTATAGSVSVTLLVDAGGIDYTNGAEFTVTISDPAGTDTQDDMIVGDTLTSTHALRAGDCFHVNLIAPVTLIDNPGCDFPFESTCDRVTYPQLDIWPGTDYSISW